MDKETEDDGKINKKNTEVKSNHIDEDAELKRLTNYINNRGGKNEQLPNSNTRAR
jgi:hypothetical protein